MKLFSYQELHAAGIAPWCRDHLRRKCAAGEFPKPVALSRERSGKGRTLRWVAEDIEAYSAALVAERDGTTAE